MECLNAPFGARCFLTRTCNLGSPQTLCLNAPFGARCFLTLGEDGGERALLRGSKCTFWRSVLSDFMKDRQERLDQLS